MTKREIRCLLPVVPEAENPFSMDVIRCSSGLTDEQREEIRRAFAEHQCDPFVHVSLGYKPMYITERLDGAWDIVLPPVPMSATFMDNQGVAVEIDIHGISPALLDDLARAASRAEMGPFAIVPEPKSLEDRVRDRVDRLSWEDQRALYVGLRQRMDLDRAKAIMLNKKATDTEREDALSYQYLYALGHRIGR